MDKTYSKLRFALAIRGNSTYCNVHISNESFMQNHLKFYWALCRHHHMQTFKRICFWSPSTFKSILRFEGLSKDSLFATFNWQILAKKGVEIGKEPLKTQHKLS